ncbi:MAG: flagellar basal body rod protein FlgB [Pseudomonadota bacterium]
MDLYGINLFKGLRLNMNWLNARQNVIAENVANADTPGYRARDLEKPDFSALFESVSRGDGARGHKPHAGEAPVGGVGSSEPYRETTVSGWEVSPTQNTVTIEEEMLRMTETQVEFQMATNLYKKSLNMLRIAVRGGN